MRLRRLINLRLAIAVVIVSRGEADPGSSHPPKKQGTRELPREFLITFILTL
jgi:hypothetical protein